MPEPHPDRPRAIRDYPRITFTMRTDTRKLLEALAAHENRSSWRVVESALQDYYERRRPKDRAAIDTRLAGKPSASSEVVPVEVPRRVEKAVQAFLRFWTRPKNEAEKITREFLALTLALPLDRKEENRS